jgi:glycosyltransferase involved in cell wall biosynthesis
MRSSWNQVGTATSPASLVSVLIPCWSCREYIRETIDSALAQDYQPLEIVVVEDCGSDGTYEEALKVRDPRLRVVRNERNYGQYGNKNRALELARGEFIKFIDGDDRIGPGCVSRLMQAQRDAGPGTGIVFGNFVVIDEHGRMVGKPAAWGVSGRVRGLGVLEAVTRPRQAGSRFGNVSPHLFHKQTLASVGGFPNDNAGPGDLETFLKLLCHTDACFVEERLASYRVRPDSMGTRTFGLRECTDFLRMVKRLEVYFREQPEVPAHLRDRKFLNEWKVWAGSHNLFASYVLKRRKRPNQYDAIREMYREAGLAAEFERVMSRDFPRFVLQTLMRKARVAVGLPDQSPLLGRRERSRG